MEIRGTKIIDNVFGGGNNAAVTGDSHVTIGKEEVVTPAPEPAPQPAPEPAPEPYRFIDAPKSILVDFGTFSVKNQHFFRKYMP